MLASLDISASGLAAQRIRMDVIAENIANAHTTRDAEGRPSPYCRREVVFAPTAASGPGVSVAEIRRDATPPRRVFDPDHPDAVDGYVAYPNVNVIQEMVDMTLASRSYEANVTAIETAKSMYLAALRILG
ncbi:MAG: flagellar basal body rod protein FlgC [Planctomycetes bacterium]|nr:flagellar basal body rod protein FlgC [Planctomycetota bacterium]